MPKPVCFTYSSSQWQESHSFFKKYVSMVSYFTVTDGSGWGSWQRWNCPSLPVLSHPAVETLTELSFFLLTPAAKTHRFSNQMWLHLMDDSTTLWLTFFSGRGGRIFLVCQSFSPSHLKLLSVPLCVCVCFCSSTSNEARCSWYAEKCYSGCRYAVCLDFIWSRDALSACLTISLVNLLKKCLDALAVSSVYWLCQSRSHKPLAMIRKMPVRDASNGAASTFHNNPLEAKINKSCFL